MSSFPMFLAVAGGGAVGAAGRYAVTLAAARLFGPAFPWGTLAVNVVGCTLMGVLVHALAARGPGGEGLRAFLAVGVLGGFTTFSAFALDLVSLYREKALAGAALYLAASVVLSVGGLVAGLAIARAWL